MAFSKFEEQLNELEKQLGGWIAPLLVVVIAVVFIVLTFLLALLLSKYNLLFINNSSLD